MFYKEIGQLYTLKPIVTKIVEIMTISNNTIAAEYVKKYYRNGISMTLIFGTWTSHSNLRGHGNIYVYTNFNFCINICI